MKNKGRKAICFSRIHISSVLSRFLKKGPYSCKCCFFRMFLFVSLQISMSFEGIFVSRILNLLPFIILFRLISPYHHKLRLKRLIISTSKAGKRSPTEEPEQMVSKRLILYFTYPYD